MADFGLFIMNKLTLFVSGIGDQVAVVEKSKLEKLIWDNYHAVKNEEKKAKLRKTRKFT